MDYLRLMIQRIQNKYSIDRKTNDSHWPMQNAYLSFQQLRGHPKRAGVKGTSGESPLLHPAALR